MPNRTLRPGRLRTPNWGEVRDLWKGEDLGVFSGKFSAGIKIKGARLLRISPQP